MYIELTKIIIVEKKDRPYILIIFNHFNNHYEYSVYACTTEKNQYDLI